MCLNLLLLLFLLLILLLGVDASGQLPVHHKEKDNAKKSHVSIQLEGFKGRRQKQR